MKLPPGNSITNNTLKKYNHSLKYKNTMALEVTKLTREFKFKKNGTGITLPDPNPDFTQEEVMQFYSGQYPELTTATLEGPKIEGDKAVYSVSTTVGTKG